MFINKISHNANIDVNINKHIIFKIIFATIERRACNILRITNTVPHELIKFIDLLLASYLFIFFLISD